MSVLAFIARHARLGLVAGLLVGIALPDLAQAFRPAIAPLIVTLLFLAVLRLGPEALLAGVRDLPRALGLALLLQLALPLAAVAAFALAGVLAHPIATGTVLVLAAAPITGSPHITQMAGADPAPALRQLVVGTAILPLTVFPVFLLMPGFGSPLAVGRAALVLLILILAAGGAAVALRQLGIVKAGPRAFVAMDAASAVLLALVVIGLMSAIAPALTGDGRALIATLIAVFALNIPLQFVASAVCARARRQEAPALGVVAGNRNLALFLSVLPQATADDLLLFIGCFQIPMYLTPFLMMGWYRRIRGG